MVSEKQNTSEKANQFSSRRALIFSVLFLFICILTLRGFVWAHGGHGKAEVQFKVAPKQVDNPQQTVIKVKDIRVTRQEFFNYIRNISAFQMKADLLQREFLLHFWVIEGISRYYPADINMLMQRLVEMGPEWADRAGHMNDWAEKQAGLFARLLLYYKKAKAGGLDEDPEIRWVLECFSKHVKADFMEEMVLLGSMPTTFQGMRDFISGMQPPERKQIEKKYKDPDTVGPVGRRKLSKRWIQYRRDLMKHTKYERLFENIDSINIPPDTVIATVNEHRITLAQFLAVYGPMVNDMNWNSLIYLVKKQKYYLDSLIPTQV